MINIAERTPAVHHGGEHAVGFGRGRCSIWIPYPYAGHLHRQLPHHAKGTKRAPADRRSTPTPSTRQRMLSAAFCGCSACLKPMWLCNMLSDPAGSLAWRGGDVVTAAPDAYGSEVAGFLPRSVIVTPIWTGSATCSPILLGTWPGRVFSGHRSTRSDAYRTWVLHAQSSVRSKCHRGPHYKSSGGLERS
jgi:hypothetical protein